MNTTIDNLNVPSFNVKTSSTAEAFSFLDEVYETLRGDGVADLLEAWDDAEDDDALERELESFRTFCRE